MKIALIGQAAFAERVLDGLRADQHEVVALYCPPDAAGGRVDPVKQRALDLGVPVRQHKSLKQPEVRDEFAALGADLAVLAYVTQIVPPAVFELPARGSICFHPSLLPRYRGGSAVNWQIIRGESEAGVSVFWVDPGIDTGPLLLQRSVAIGPDDTAGSLYYDKLFPMGVDVVLESVRLIQAGTAPREVQDETRATYDPLCRDEHAQVDWTRPMADVHNLIRGCDPQPGAYVAFAGAKLRLFDAQRAAAASAEPGTIIALDDAGLTVACAGGAVRIGRVRHDAGKVGAAEFAAAKGLDVGSRLGDSAEAAR